jgi:hypothetical protein
MLHRLHIDLSFGIEAPDLKQLTETASSEHKEEV